jgi:hypothetical protein
MHWGCYYDTSLDIDVDPSFNGNPLVDGRLTVKLMRRVD